MYFRMIIRPVYQNCFCQKNIFIQNSILYPLSVQVLLRNSKYFMSRTTNVNKNPVTTDTSLLNPKNVVLAAVPDQNFSSSSENSESTEVKKLSNKDKLKRAVKDYGATVIVFHVTISLMSLGISYLVVSSGVDVDSLLKKIGLDLQSKLATGASTFVIAYAIHKIFAPIRIGITLGATPFIVRYLRRVRILKAPRT